MRRAVPLLLVLSILAPAHAQVVSPEIARVALPLTATTTLEREVEHGCSQSFESVAAHATLHLAIGPGGLAELRLDGDYRSNMGPSPGRYMAGDHEFTRLTELHRATWRGTATVGQSGVTVAIATLEEAQARFTGYGTLPLPTPTARPFAAQLQCTIAPTDVLPAAPADGERPTPMRLLSCAWDQPPDAFARFAEGAFVMGAGAGVRQIASDTMFGASSHEVRLPPS